MKRYFKDTGIKFIGRLPLVCIQKGSDYYQNLLSAIDTLEQKESKSFTDNDILNYLKEAANTIPDEGSGTGCYETFRVTSRYPKYLHLITGEDPKLYKKLIKWISNGFTGRTGVEVFFVSRIGYQAHRQVMIADHTAKTIYYIEPNVGIGETTMKDLFKLVFYGSGYKVVDLEWENCPMAFQAVDRTDGIEDNYCQTWSMFAGILFALNHPKFTKEQIFGWLVSLGDRALEVLTLFMFRIYTENASMVASDSTVTIFRNYVLSQLNSMIDSFNELLIANNRPRQVRDDIKPCRKLIWALIDSAAEAFRNLPDAGLRIDQFYYIELIKDIKDVVYRLLYKYRAMIDDRSEVCSEGEFAREISALIDRLNSNYMSTGMFSSLLSERLISLYKK